MSGKSSAIQHAAQEPLEHIELEQYIISKTTSSGLVKSLSTRKNGLILSPEVFDVLNKLMKSDEENATGDIQLLCKLFSGEKCNYQYSTEQTRVIDQNTPFSILGSTQLVNAAKVVAKMDHGHGLIDRLLIATPLALRPSLTEMESAKNYLTSTTTDDFLALMERVNNIELNSEFSFDEDAQQHLRDYVDQFVADVNVAILAGQVPPKSKTPELIPRLAAALHVFNHVMKEILEGLPESQPPATISKTTLQNAAAFVNHLESQKEILCQVINIYFVIRTTMT